jgi:hypothetical protein
MPNDAKLIPQLTGRALQAETQAHADSSSFKPGDKPEDSLNVVRGAIRAPSPDPSLISIDDSTNIRLGRSPNYVPGYRHASCSPAPPRTLRARLQISWVKNKGLALVLIAQLFGTLMNVTTRMLEMEGNDGEYGVGRENESALTTSHRQGLSSFPDPVC